MKELNNMKLYLHPKQIAGAGERITGNEIYQHLKDTDMLKDCATVEDLKGYSSGKKVIPNEWRGKIIYAWKSVRNADGYLDVPYLHCYADKPYERFAVRWSYLDLSWYEHEPALLFASSTNNSDTNTLPLDTMNLEKAIENGDIFYTTKDSGNRVEYPSGFTRDITDDKPRYDLIPHEMLTRLAGLYTRGAVKYGDNNWQLADKDNPEEINRFKQSAYRHFIQWFRGDEDEDHMSAVVFNLFCYEWLTKHKNKNI
jgi:hypothetical protein